MHVKDKRINFTLHYQHINQPADALLIIYSPLFTIRFIAQYFWTQKAEGCQCNFIFQIIHHYSHAIMLFTAVYFLVQQQWDSYLDLKEHLHLKELEIL
jgi:hypothetical protein